MPTLKPGQKQVQFVMDEGSEMHLTLLEWAKNRGLSLGKASRVILADWSDAINGKPNPFAAAISAVAGQPMQSLPATPAPTQELSAEERARQAALLQAAEQFM
jgi:hypothetical protein